MFEVWKLILYTYAGYSSVPCTCILITFYHEFWSSFFLNYISKFVLILFALHWIATSFDISLFDEILKLLIGSKKSFIPSSIFFLDLFFSTVLCNTIYRTGISKKHRQQNVKFCLFNYKQIKYIVQLYKCKKSKINNTHI